MRSRILSFATAALLLAGGRLAAGERAVSAVAVAPAFFNPSAGQRVTLSFEVERAGRLEVSILDRDRLAVRHLATHEVQPGPVRLTWDGRDEAGIVVPDESYSLRIELAHAGGREVYDPSANFTPVLENPGAAEYSRVDGSLSYRLTRPARVHVQAGQAWRDAKTGKMTGPILKTVLDRVPRVAGAVVETWNGMDESRTVYVPDLAHFAVAVLASSLPESSLITVGNRRQGFAEYASARDRRSPRPAPAEVRAGAHHSGLTALEDRSPRLEVQVREAAHAYVITAKLAPDEAPHFLSQPTRLLIFLDDRVVLERERPKHPAELTIPRRGLSLGAHRVVVNWGSDYGPVAVGVARIVVPPKAGVEGGR